MKKEKSKENDWKVEFVVPDVWNRENSNFMENIENSPDGNPLNFSNRMPATLDVMSFKLSDKFKEQYPMFDLDVVTIAIEYPEEKNDGAYVQSIHIDLNSERYNVPKDTPEQFLNSLTGTIYEIVRVLDKFKSYKDDDAKVDLDIKQCDLLFVILAIRYWKEYSDLFAGYKFIPSNDMISCFSVAYSF